MKDFKIEQLYGNVHSIETLGAFDGPGLRYVLFLQGCPMKCKFCHNRDTWGTGTNKLMTVEEVLNDYDRYKAFYKKGGLTVSGGEATLQLEFITELFRQAKEKGIHTCLDTAAPTFTETRKAEFNKLLDYTDLVLLDIKHIDNDIHKWLTGLPNKNILKFSKLLDDRRIPTSIRHILLPDINSQDEYVIKLRTFLDTLSNVVSIEVLPYHTKGITKWEQMGLKYELLETPEPSEELIKHVETILKSNYQYMN